VVLEDLDSDCLGHYIKIWSDRYAIRGEVKGTTTDLNYSILIITSNWSIADLFVDCPKMIDPI